MSTKEDLEALLVYSDLLQDESRPGGDVIALDHSIQKERDTVKRAHLEAKKRSVLLDYRERFSHKLGDNVGIEITWNEALIDLRC